MTEATTTARCTGPVVEDGSRRNLQGLDPRSHPPACARTGSTSPTRWVARSLPTSRCAQPPPALPVFALLTPLTPHQKISLVCAACLKTDEPEKCTHKLAEMPRWLSSNKMVRTFFSCHMHAILSLNARPRSVYRKSSRASSQVRIRVPALVPRRRACMCTMLTCLPLLRRRPRHAAPRVHGPCLRRHAQGLPVAPGGCIF